MQDVIEFLRQLRLHNDRTWFEANKSWYRDAQSQFAAFVEELIAGIVTEKGICRPPYTKSLKALFDDKK